MPIARGVFKDSLTYFSKEAFPVGSVIFATIRGKKVPAIVLSSHDAREEKMELKNSSFALKKLPANIKAHTPFSKEFIEAAKKTAAWHGIHEGLAIALLTSTYILESAQHVEQAPTRTETEPLAKADFLVFQASRDERVRTYRNLAREAFARNASILIIAPTVIEAELMASELKRGIEERVVLLTSEMPKRSLLTEWNKAVTSREPVVIVGVQFALSVPRTDVDTIIVERESARAYRSVARPNLDIRRAARALSRETGARLIVADFPLRVETRHLVDIHLAEELARSQVRPGTTASLTVLDERKSDSIKNEKRQFQVIDDVSREKIKTVIAKKGRVALYATRRGLAPLTVCNDCGTPVSDPSSGAPMSLHKTTRGNVFISHRSGAVIPGNTTCKVCGGWNLVTLGIGIDRAVEELEKYSLGTVFTLTKDSASTHKKASKIAENFYSTEGSVIAGTERMLPYLKESVDLVVVASVDSMLSRPEWRSDEHSLSILFYLWEHARDEFIVETRRPEHDVIKTLQGGNPADFYRAQVSQRETYLYPPFSVFVGLTSRGTESMIAKNAELIKSSFQDLDLVGPLPAESLGKNDWVVRAVIRVPPHEWPSAELIERLKNLPPDITVSVDPDEIA